MKYPSDRNNGGPLRRFAGDARGNVALFTALAAIPLLVAAGVAIDVARSSRSQTALQVAVDAAALAVASSGKSNMDGMTASQKEARKKELEDLATRFLRANYQADRADVTVQIEVTDEDVTVQATEQFPTTLMNLAGIASVDLGARASVNLPGANLEIVMVMDTTGSMRRYGRMDYAKDAATTLLDTVLGKGVNSNSKVKFALVPFSGSVNVGTDNLSWIDTTGRATASRLNFASADYHNMKAWSDLRYRNSRGQLTTLAWNGCVEARLGDLALNDTPPSASAPNTLFTPYFAPDEPDKSGYNNNYLDDKAKKNASDAERLRNEGKYAGQTVDPSDPDNSGPWSNCAASPIIPLTDKRAPIDAGIELMQPRGGTLLAEGIMWAWRVLSPEQPYVGASFTDKKWRKVVIFMTDGENDMGTNDTRYMPPAAIGTSYSSYGYGATEPVANNRYGSTSQRQARAKLDEKFRAACTGLKSMADPSRGEAPPSVVIYTVAFQAPEAVKNDLKACATAPRYYVDAANGPELLSKFEEIGRSLTALYLSR